MLTIAQKAFDNSFYFFFPIYRNNHQIGFLFFNSIYSSHNSLILMIFFSFFVSFQCILELTHLQPIRRLHKTNIKQTKNRNKIVHKLQRAQCFVSLVGIVLTWMSSICYGRQKDERLLFLSLCFVVVVLFMFSSTSSPSLAIFLCLFLLFSVICVCKSAVSVSPMCSCYCHNFTIYFDSEIDRVLLYLLSFCL